MSIHESGPRLDRGLIGGLAVMLGSLYGFLGAYLWGSWPYWVFLYGAVPTTALLGLILLLSD